MNVVGKNDKAQQVPQGFTSIATEYATTIIGKLVTGVREYVGSLDQAQIKKPEEYTQKGTPAVKDERVAETSDNVEIDDPSGKADKEDALETLQDKFGDEADDLEVAHMNKEVIEFIEDGRYNSALEAAKEAMENAEVDVAKKDGNEAKIDASDVEPKDTEKTEG